MEALLPRRLVKLESENPVPPQSFGPLQRANTSKAILNCRNELPTSQCRVPPQIGAHSHRRSAGLAAEDFRTGGIDFGAAYLTYVLDIFETYCKVE